MTDGSCETNLGNLHTGLDLSIVERKEKGKVVNYWRPFREPYKKAKVMATFVCGKKNK